MCDRCKAKDERILALERTIIALTSNQRACELVEACKEILCPPEHHCTEDEGRIEDWLEEEAMKQDEWNRVKTR